MMEAPVWVEEFFQANYFPRDVDRALFPPGFVYFDGLMRVDLDADRHGFFKFKTHAPVLRKKLILQRLPANHPASNNGRGVGLFARHTIFQGEVIGEYGGMSRVKTHLKDRDKIVETVVLNIATRHDRKDTTYQLETKNVVIDAKYWGNEMRFINHFEGIGKQNIDFWTKFDEDGSEYCKMAAICDIEEGDELLTDYGEGYCKIHKIGRYSQMSALLSASQVILEAPDVMEVEPSEEDSPSSQN